MGEVASSEVTKVAAATSSQDPEVGLAAVAALRGLVEVLEALQVENARAKGWSWRKGSATATSAPSTWCWGSSGTVTTAPARCCSPSASTRVAARTALCHLADRGVVPGPRPSDAELLGSLGIDLAAIRRTTEESFGAVAVGWAIREATRARRRGVGRVPRTPRRDPPMLIGQVLYHAGEQARALGLGVVGPEPLLWGVVADIRTPRPRCMNNRWRRQLHASVGLAEGYRGAAGLLLVELGVDLDQLREAVMVELGGVQR